MTTARSSPPPLTRSTQSITYTSYSRKDWRPTLSLAAILRTAMTFHSHDDVHRAAALADHGNAADLHHMPSAAKMMAVADMPVMDCCGRYVGVIRSVLRECEIADRHGRR